MRFRLLGMACLMLAALTLNSGCTTTKVSDLDNQMEFNWNVDSTGQRRDYRAVVYPFTDGREREYSTNKWYCVPGLGLGLMFIPSMHTHPEITFNHYSNVVTDVSGGAMEYVRGDFSQTLARKFGDGLKEAGVFSEVKYADKLDENYDVRNYDYVIRGRVVRTDLRLKQLDYGLNFFTLIDVSWVLKLLAAPDMYVSGEVAYQVEIVERQSGKIVYSDKVEYDREGHLIGYYYGNRLEGKAANVGIFTQILKEQMSGTIDKVKKEVKF